MPTPQEILQHLHEVTRDAGGLAMAWHAIVAIVLAAVALGCRPDRSWFGRAVSLPLFSAGLVAWAFGNPFNSAILLGVFLLLWLTGGSRAPGREEIASSWVSLPAIGLVAFSWAYPQFSDVSKPVHFFLASPMGLIPCPTLSLVLGFSLFFEGGTGRAWKIILASAGVFYGCFGWWVLGVKIDAVLAAGAVLVLGRALFARIPGSLPGAPLERGTPVEG